MTIHEDEKDPAYQVETEKVKYASEDPRAVVLRKNIFSVIRGGMELWSAGSAIGQVYHPSLFFSVHLLMKWDP